MNKLFTILCFTALLVACVWACLPANNPAPPHADCTSDSCALPVALAARTGLNYENVQLSLPGDGWAMAQIPVEEVRLAIKNDSQNCSALLIKEGTTVSYGQYVIAVVRSFVAEGDQVSSAKQVVVNGNKFVLIQANRDHLTVWTWVTVKDGFGYGFSCGGEVMADAGSSLHDLCQDVANTLEIK